MSLILTAVAAFIISVLLTPCVRHMSRHFGIVDKPDQLRKLQGNAIALGGGLAVLGATFLTCLIALNANNAWRSTLWNQFPLIAGLGLSFLAITVLGFADDAWNLRGRQKLFGQIVICSGLVAMGFRFDSLSIFGFNFSLGMLAIPVTMLWLIGTSNALNLIDGSDGLCSTVGAIICASIAGMAYWTGNYPEATLAAALAGALLGFLVFNFPPASIYLGDSGSLLVGLAVGVLSMRAAIKGPATVTLLAPIALLSIPLFDSGMAILRRKLTGRSIYAVDRAHLHHNLLKSGYTTRGLLGVVTFLCGLTAAGAFFSVAMNQEVLALGSSVTVIGILIVSRIFGYAELRLLTKRSVNFGKTLMFSRGKSDQKIHEHVVHMQGTRTWDVIWQTLTEFAEKHHLCKVCFDLNVPWMQEGFHASWYRNKMPDSAERWQTRLPVVSRGKVVGRLDIVGPLGGEPAYRLMGLAAEMLESLENHVNRMIEERALPAEAERVVAPQEPTFGTDSGEFLQPVIATTAAVHTAS